jgi:hypothetical protein
MTPAVAMVRNIDNGSATGASNEGLQWVVSKEPPELTLRE